MRILLFGKVGQLGWECLRTLSVLGEVIPLDYPQIDLTRPRELEGWITPAKPDVIVNATGYTLVDKAESDAEKCRLINAEAPGEMARVAKKIGAALVHVSTDYVFDGVLGRAYSEQDVPHPLNEYGRSKLAGEQAVAAADGSHIILRTSWVYSNRRDSFISKVLEWAAKNPQLRIVDDQVSGPTWARSLAEALAALLAQSRGDACGWLGERRGLYHLAGWGWGSRLEWAHEILRLAGVDQRIAPAKTAEFPAAAERPLYTPLDCSLFERTFGLRLPDWKDALAMAMDRI